MIHAFRVPYPRRDGKGRSHDLEVDVVKGLAVRRRARRRRRATLVPRPRRLRGQKRARACSATTRARSRALSDRRSKLGSITASADRLARREADAFAGIFRVRRPPSRAAARTTEAEIVTLSSASRPRRAEQKDDETGEIWERSLRYVNGRVLCGRVSIRGTDPEISLEPAGDRVKRQRGVSRATTFAGRRRRSRDRAEGPLDAGARFDPDDRAGGIPPKPESELDARPHWSAEGLMDTRLGRSRRLHRPRSKHPIPAARDRTGGGRRWVRRKENRWAFGVLTSVGRSASGSVDPSAALGFRAAVETRKRQLDAGLHIRAQRQEQKVPAGPTPDGPFRRSRAMQAPNSHEGRVSARTPPASRASRATGTLSSSSVAFDVRGRALERALHRPMPGMEGERSPALVHDDESHLAPPPSRGASIRLGMGLARSALATLPNIRLRSAPLTNPAVVDIPDEARVSIGRQAVEVFLGWAVAFPVMLLANAPIMAFAMLSAIGIGRPSPASHLGDRRRHMRR